jgi:hypothetical protein
MASDAWRGISIKGERLGDEGDALVLALHILINPGRDNGGLLLECGIGIMSIVYTKRLRQQL